MVERELEAELLLREQDLTIQMLAQFPEVEHTRCFVLQEKNGTSVNAHFEYSEKNVLQLKRNGIPFCGGEFYPNVSIGYNFFGDLF